MANPPEQLVADRYAVLPAQPMPEAGGGLTTFAARDRQTGDTALIAIQVQGDQPVRAHVLQMLSVPIDGVLSPLAHGPSPAVRGEPGYFVICPAPPGPALTGNLHPWPEAPLIAFALRPIAQTLAKLAARDVTHRAIRLDNVFHGQRGHPLVLGAAWAAPPAMHQPAVFEPPYSAMCHPSGRGNGSIADDVYALGVLLLTLALGRLPLADLDEAGILRRKLEHGTYAALVGDERLPPLISDLLRGMLAEDPEHRPAPGLLLDPGVARSRRVAARPPRRAQRSLTVGGTTVWDARTLAYVMAAEPEPGIALLRNGTAEQWLRRGLGDVALAGRLEDLHRHRAADLAPEENRADAITLMRAIAVIDPLAPLCWRGLALWPDGLGPLLVVAMADPVMAANLGELIGAEAGAAWAGLRAERCDTAALRLDARQHRSALMTRGAAGGLPRLAYVLNPLLPCVSAPLADRWVARLADLPAAIEAAIAASPKAVPIDAHVIAFVAARGDSRLEGEAQAVTAGAPDQFGLPELRLLAQLQLRYYPHPMPALAAWIAGAAAPMIALWHSRPRRKELADRLRTLVQAGMLIPILALLEDPVGRTADANEARQAAATLNAIDIEMASITAAGAERTGLAARIGQEIAAGAGLIALAVMLALAVLG
jgi:hypothetical protein